MLNLSLYGTEHRGYGGYWITKLIGCKPIIFELRSSLNLLTGRHFSKESIYDTDFPPPRARQPVNQLLALLPKEDYERILPHLEPIALSLGDVLYEAGAPQRYVYFPTTCTVSMLYVMENGGTAEMAITGNEGVVGIALYMGGDTMPNRSVIQSAGCALRLKANILQKEFKLGSHFQQILLRYTQALITQMTQTAVCNRLHTLDQQLCRWLLMSCDRLATDKLVMTQELMAHMLGVRRAGITGAARLLQAEGLITYRRGHVTILDRPGLEARVCECYQVVNKEFERLFDKRLVAIDMTT